MERKKLPASSESKNSKKKSTKNPGRKKRKTRQRAKDRYSQARENAQLLGGIDTTPEGAVRDEVVDPSSQSEDNHGLAALTEEAVKRGWATPDEKKGIIVSRLIEPFEKDDVEIDKDGNERVKPPDRYLLAQNARVLGMLDKVQYERDNPELVSGKKGDVNVAVQNNVVIDPYEMFKKLLKEKGKL